MTDRTGRTCDRCFHAYAMPRQKDSQGVIDISAPQGYQCRRHPPQMVVRPNVGPIGVWPLITGDGWCGDFEGDVPEAESKAPLELGMQTHKATIGVSTQDAFECSRCHAQAATVENRDGNFYSKCDACGLETVQ